jgi:hypothetical protein
MQGYEFDESSALGWLGSVQWEEAQMEVRYDVPAGAPFETKFPQATEEDLQYVENSLGYTLPDDYRAFLTQSNGAFVPGGAEFSYGRDIDPISRRPMVLKESIVNFYNVGPYDDGFHILESFRGYDFGERVPKNYVPIGDGCRFERVVLCLDGPNRGAVYYWHPSMEWEEGPNVQTEAHLTKLAESFKGFWDKLAWPRD